MSNFKQVIAELAASDVPVLLLGEPGVGKHLVARQIHDAGPWREAQFLQCRCRHADESAVRRAFGIEREGSPCTVYFEGLEELAAGGQKSMLSCMDNQEERGPRPRVISSGTADLEMEVRAGRFREDLYYRLSGICLRIPPLRHRREDLCQLADEFLEKFAAQFSRPKPPMSQTLVRFLLAHPWSGNLDELEDAMRTVVAVGNVPVAISALRSAPAGNGRERRNGTEPVSLKQAARAASQRAERELILKVLSKTNWNRKKAAEELRISYKALLYKLKEIGSTPAALVGQEGKGE
ncbi:MAG TPA: sigma 54-interacting transcriptional regulator [Terriglobales bacterium]|nr:sigma 54-interacting transcriptional regulator [Terriglobales bacterium]